MIHILDNVKYQFFLFSKSKHILSLLLCSICLITMYSIGQFAQLDANINSYKNDLRVFTDSGISEKEALALENEKQVIKGANGDILTIEQNPLINSKIAIVKTLYSIQPYYFLQNILEGATFLFFPIILIVFTILTASQEYENKMIRIRALKSNWGNIMLSKLLFSIIVTFCFILFTSIVAYFVANIQYEFIDRDIINKFYTDEFKIAFHPFLNITISVLVSIVFVSISLCMVTMTKSKIIPILIIFIYLLVIPSLGIFDLKNILMNLTLKYFPYQGTSILANVQSIPISFCLLYCGAIIIVSVTLSYIIANKQTKYM